MLKIQEEKDLVDIVKDQIKETVVRNIVDKEDVNGI